LLSLSKTTTSILSMMVSSFSVGFKRSGGSGELAVECGCSRDHHYRLDVLGMSSYRPVLRRLNVDLTSSATDHPTSDRATRRSAVSQNRAFPKLSTRTDPAHNSHTQSASSFQNRSEGVSTSGLPTIHSVRRPHLPRASAINSSFSFRNRIVIERTIVLLLRS
jgi:hypothetical protein